MKSFLSNLGFLIALSVAIPSGVLSFTGSHSPLIGYAFDGYPIYGPYTDGGVLPSDLDQCNGRTHATLGYIYHVSANAPYVMGCYRGKVLCSTVRTSDCIQDSDVSNTGVSETVSCSKMNAELKSGEYPMQVKGTVLSANLPTRNLCTQACCNTDITGYSYDTGNQIQFSTANSVSCSSETDTIVTVLSNGLPNHLVGTFPMSDGTSTASGRSDNPNTLAAQSYIWKIPRFPQPKTGEIKSVLEDSNALPMGPIGMAINGVPFFNPFNAEGNDAASPCNDGFEVMDYCGGHPQQTGGYHYHNIPWCLFTDSASSQTNWNIAHNTTCFLNYDFSDGTCVKYLDDAGNYLGSSSSDSSFSSENSDTSNDVDSGENNNSSNGSSENTPTGGDEDKADDDQLDDGANSASLNAPRLFYMTTLSFFILSLTLD
eukprot:Nk52_evm39s96 gene=Nk52_evmTU39s96